MSIAAQPSRLQIRQTSQTLSENAVGAVASNWPLRQVESALHSRLLVRLSRTNTAQHSTPTQANFRCNGTTSDELTPARPKMQVGCWVAYVGVTLSYSVAVQTVASVQVALWSAVAGAVS